MSHISPVTRVATLIHFTVSEARRHHSVNSLSLADFGILLELSVRDCIYAELYTKLNNKISKLSRIIHYTSILWHLNLYSHCHKHV